MKYLLCLVFLYFLFSSHGQVERKVVFEESAGTWCQVCPRGYVYSEMAHTEYGDEVIFITSHFDDPMAYPEYVTALDPPGYPSGFINRNSFIDFQPSSLDSDVSPYLNQTSPFELAVAIDIESGFLTADVSLNLSEDLVGNYRLGGIVIENSVTGPAPEYNQHNGYSGGSAEMGTYQFSPVFVPGELMMYNHVARQLLGGFDGEESSLPMELSATETYSSEFSWEISNGIDSDNVQVVAVIINQDTGEIENAALSFYLNGDDNAAPFFQSPPVTNGQVLNDYSYEVIVHDADYDELSLEIISNDSDWLEIEVNELGNFVLTGIPESQGEELVELSLSDGQHTILQEFSLLISAQGYDWIQLGQEHFSEEPSDKLGAEVTVSNRVFSASSFTADAVSKKVVYELIEGWWEPLDSITSFSGEQLVMASNSMGELFLKDAQLLYKLNSSNELELVFPFGIPQGEMAEMKFSPSDNLYCAVSSNSGGEVKSLTEGVWNDLGAFSSEYSYWNKMAFSSSEDLILLFGESTNDEVRSHVSSWNGVEWIPLGGGLIDGNVITHDSHDIVVTSTGEVYVALISDPLLQSIDVYTLTGDEWVLIHQNVANGPALSVDMEFDSADNLYVTYLDQNQSNKLTTKKLVGNEWEFIGQPGFSSVANDFEFSFLEDDVPFVVYSDLVNSRKCTSKKYENTVGVEELISNKFHPVYPNPVEDLVHFEGENFESVTILNSEGKFILNHKVKANVLNEIDVSTLEKGEYYLRFSGSKNKSARIVKL